jgi:phage replication O-like protein O
MADVRLEKGFLRIANELMDAFARIRIPGEAWQVLAVIIRQTYGWGKKSDRIPLSRFVEMTGLRMRSVRRALERLLAMNLIARSGGSGGIEYSIIKDHDQWKPASNRDQGAQKCAVRNNAHGRVRNIAQLKRQ